MCHVMFFLMVRWPGVELRSAASGKELTRRFRSFSSNEVASAKRGSRRRRRRRRVVVVGSRRSYMYRLHLFFFFCP